MLQWVSLMMFLLPLNPPAVTAPSPWSRRRQADWWHDLGSDWEVSNTLRQRSPQYATYRHMSRQMNHHAPALHRGRIYRGQLPNPAKYRPRDRTFGENADFNQKDLKKGVFKRVPDDDGKEVKTAKSRQTFVANEAAVEAGMAKCVGDIFNLPTVVTVMEDGSYTVKTRHKQNPCARNPNPCQKFGPFRKSYCSKEEDYKVSCDPRNDPFQLDLVWTSGRNLDIRVIAIDAATGDVLGDGDGGDEISHKDVGGALGAIVPANTKKCKTATCVEKLLLKTLADGSDYKDYVYAITAHRTKNNNVELQNTGGKLEVKYNGKVENTFYIPQGAGANPPRNNGKFKRRYLFGCFKPGYDGHYLDTSVARFENGGTSGKARMAELCRPRPSELCL